MKLYDMDAEIKTIKSLLDSPTKVKEKLYSKLDISFFGEETTQELFKRIKTLKDGGKKLGTTKTFKHDSSLSEEAKTLLEPGVKPVKKSADARSLKETLNTYRKYRIITTTLQSSLGDLKKKNINMSKIADDFEKLAKDLKDPDAIDLSKLQEIRETEKKQYPTKMRDEAFQGVIGDFVKQIAPHTEASPEAILICGLLCFGNILGKGPYWQAGGDIHYMNLFVSIIGLSGEGRKGMALGIITAIMKGIDPEWDKNCKLGGLSTGEGILNRIQDSEAEIENDDIKVKRALFYEEEFSRPMKSAKRIGCNLAEMLCGAFDSRKLMNSTKTSPMEAENYLVSILGQTTITLIKKHLTSEEFFSGFANRFQFCLVKRGDEQSDGGIKVTSDLFPVHHRILRNTVEYFKLLGKDNDLEMKFSPAALKLWKPIYSKWYHGAYKGVLRSVLARADVNVKRMACIYALLHGSLEIKSWHLKAAVAVWDYMAESAQILFGGSCGDPVGDEILEELKKRPGGLSKTEMHNAIRLPRSELSESADNLAKLGLVRVEKIPTKTKPTHRYFHKDSDKGGLFMAGSMCDKVKSKKFDITGFDTKMKNKLRKVKSKKIIMQDFVVNECPEP